VIAVTGKRKPGAGAKEPTAEGRPASGRRRRTAPKPRPAVPPAPVSIPSREQLIAEAAYYRAERRNFAGGREMDDWLAAEEEIDSLINPVRESIDEADNIGPIP
jgi:hypothetical protein